MKRLILILLGTWFFLSRCSVQLYVPTEINVARNNIPLADLEKGRKLYIDNCSNCHNLHAPGRYTPEKWEHELNKMQKKAKINDESKKLIYGYLTSEVKLEGRD